MHCVWLTRGQAQYSPVAKDVNISSSLPGAQRYLSSLRGAQRRGNPFFELAASIKSKWIASLRSQ